MLTCRVLQRLTQLSKLRAEQSSIIQDHQRQVEYLQKTAESTAERTRKRNDADSADHQRQLESLQRTADSTAERIRKRTDAEIVDLRASISKLESELTKVILTD